MRQNSILQNIDEEKKVSMPEMKPKWLYIDHDWQAAMLDFATKKKKGNIFD